MTTVTLAANMLDTLMNYKDNVLPSPYAIRTTAFQIPLAPLVKVIVRQLSEASSCSVMSSEIDIVIVICS